MADPFDYLETRADADDLITDAGRSVMLRRMTKGGAAWEPTLTPTDYATFAVRVEFTLRQLQRNNVQATDQRWLVAAGPLAALGITSIAPTDSLVIDGADVEVVRADALNPAGTPVMFDCHLRF
jgi:hypothetical protein